MSTICEHRNQPNNILRFFDFKGGIFVEDNQASIDAVPDNVGLPKACNPTYAAYKRNVEWATLFCPPDICMMLNGAIKSTEANSP
jgi:hypothetical protein